MVFPVHTNRRHFVTQDVFVPWKNKVINDTSNDSSENTFYRYYHDPYSLRHDI